MKNSTMKILLFISVAVILAACQSSQNANNSESVDMETESHVEPAAPEARRRYQPRERPRLEPEFDQAQARQEVIPTVLDGLLASDGQGLTLMIDASSTETLHQSLELVATETSQEQFENLRTAMQVIQRYDPEAWSGKEALLPLIDGRTGEEIIEHAERLNSW